MKYTIGTNNAAIPVYKNSLNRADDSDAIISVFGVLEVRDGALRCASDKASDHSTAIINTPNLMDFSLSVDLVGRVGGGGVLFSCDGERARKSSEEDMTAGYYAFISRDGDAGAIGCTTPVGKWSGNFSVSPKGRLDMNSDLSLFVRSSGNFIIYTVNDKKSGEEVYRYEYRKGYSRYDNSPFEVGVTALRLNNDGGKGGFKDLAIYERKKATVSDVKLSVLQKMELDIAPGSFEEFITFTDQNGMGFAFSYDAKVERLFLYRYNDGELLYVAEHAMMLTENNKYPVCIVNKGDVLSIYVQDMRYPVLEALMTSPCEYAIGSSNEISFEISEYTEPEYEGKTYQNPVAHGADPEILYHDGYFYLYNLDKRNEPNRVRVRRSRDLAQWEEAGFCFVPDENTPIQTFMSPNVFCKDGIFYLLIASHVGGTGSHEYYVFYAHSDSPTGPFIMDSDPPYVNAHQEIGGAPFIDDDGRVYLSYVRFGGGNHVYVQEIDAKGGRITTVGEAAHCYSPTEHYEIDDYGRISEGGVIVKHNGYYYMMYACGHFRGHYGEAYGVSKSVLGPYKKYKYNNPLHYTEYVDGAGDCMFVPMPDKQEVFVVYHKHTVVGNKGYDRGVCVDRVYFVPSEDGGPDVLRVYGPTVTEQPIPKFLQDK